MNTVVRELSVVELEQVTGGGLWDDLCTMGNYIMDDPMGAANAAWDGATSAFDGWNWSDATGGLGCGIPLPGFDSDIIPLPNPFASPEDFNFTFPTEWGLIGTGLEVISYTLGTAWGNAMYGEYGLLNC